MPQDARDHRLLGDDSNDPECTTSAKGTRDHLQAKDAAQQPGPRPVWGARLRFLPVQPRLAQCRTDHPTQVAVRREAAPIAHEMDARQGHERGQLLQDKPRQHLCYVYASLSRLGFRGLPEKLFIVFEGVIGFSTAKKPTALMMHWWNGGRGGAFLRGSGVGWGGGQSTWPCLRWKGGVWR